MELWAVYLWKNCDSFLWMSVAFHKWLVTRTVYAQDSWLRQFIASKIWDKWIQVPYTQLLIQFWFNRMTFNETAKLHLLAKARLTLPIYEHLWFMILKESELHNSIGSLIRRWGSPRSVDYLGRSCPKTFETAKGLKENWCRRESNPGPLAWAVSALPLSYDTHRQQPLFLSLILLCSRWSLWQ